MDAPQAVTVAAIVGILEAMLSRILTGIVVPAIVLLFLLWMRHDTILKPYETGWLVWVFAILASGVGWGVGMTLIWLEYRRGHPRAARVPVRSHP